MKKFVLLSMLSLMFCTTAMAQVQDPWVGTWTSESFIRYGNTYKLVIRITMDGDQYNVRAKEIRPDDPNYSSYHFPLTVTKAAGKTMWLESYVKKDPFTVDYGNGPFIESYSDQTYYYMLTLNNGTLHYSHYKIHMIDYDRNMKYTGENSINCSDGTGNELDLFNDNW